MPRLAIQHRSSWPRGHNDDDAKLEHVRAQHRAGSTRHRKRKAQGIWAPYVSFNARNVINRLVDDHFLPDRMHHKRDEVVDALVRWLDVQTRR